MLMMTPFTTILSAFLVAASSAIAAPTGPVELDVFSPTIDSPATGSIWTAGSAQSITWDTSNIPAANMNSTGLILLGYMENNSENLNISHPLASGFAIKDGSANITVPSVPTRMDYIVVLFGDSGNASPQFTILGGL